MEVEAKEQTGAQLLKAVAYLGSSNQISASDPGPEQQCAQSYEKPQLEHITFAWGFFELIQFYVTIS